MLQHIVWLSLDSYNKILFQYAQLVASEADKVHTYILGTSNKRFFYSSLENMYYHLVPTFLGSSFRMGMQALQGGIRRYVVYNNSKYQTSHMEWSV